MLSITCPGLMYFITGNYRSPRPPLSLEPLICSLYPHSLILNFNGRLLCVRGTGPGLGAEEAELPQTRSLSSNAIKYKRRTWQACQRESSLTVLRQMCYERWGGGRGQEEDLVTSAQLALGAGQPERRWPLSQECEDEELSSWTS